MRTDSKAQSVIEYAMIVVLVTVGVLIMGPYVIRSINAFFKGGEIQVEDSFREELKQGPPTGEEFPNCDCDHYHDRGCGDGFSCDFRKRVLWQYCEPMGCEDYFGIPIINPYCEWDDECCTPPEPTECGFLAPGGGCPQGVMGTIRFCGEHSEPRYDCDPSLPGCTFYCDDKDPNSEWCHPEGNGGLSEPVETIHYDHGECPTDPLALRCAAECNEGYVLKNGACAPDACLRAEDLILRRLGYRWETNPRPAEPRLPGIIKKPIEDSNFYVMNEAYHTCFDESCLESFYYPDPYAVDPSDPEGTYSLDVVEGNASMVFWGRPENRPFDPPVPSDAIVVGIRANREGGRAPYKFHIWKEGQIVFTYQGRVNVWLEIVFFKACCGEDNRVIDPSFETLALLAGRKKCHSPQSGYNHVIRGWFVSNLGEPNGCRGECRTAEIHNNINGQAQDGNQHLALRCGAHLTSYRPLAVAPGKEYEVSFYFSPMPGNENNTVGVYWNNTHLGTVDGDGTGLADTVWEKHTFRVTAYDGNNILQFRDESGPPDDAGGYIDNVRVVTHPDTCR